MTILLMLIPVGLVILAVAVAVFIWAVRNGQFEDLEGEGERIFFDDTPLPARPARGRDRAGGSDDSSGSSGSRTSRVAQETTETTETTKAKS